MPSTGPGPSLHPITSLNLSLITASIAIRGLIVSASSVLETVLYIAVPIQMIPSTRDPVVLSQRSKPAFATNNNNVRT